MDIQYVKWQNNLKIKRQGDDEEEYRELYINMFIYVYIVELLLLFFFQIE